MPALLEEDLFIFIDVRMKDRVQVHVHQVLEVLVVDAGRRIDRLVRIGHGIEKGIERALYQLHKRILGRKSLRTAEHRVLHDMGNPRVVLHGRAEADRKDLVLVVIGNNEQSGAAFFVTEQVCPPVKLLYLPLLDPLIRFRNHIQAAPSLKIVIGNYKT